MPLFLLILDIADSCPSTLHTSCRATTHTEAFDQTLLREGITYDQIQAATIIPFPPKPRSLPKKNRH